MSAKKELSSQQYCHLMASFREITDFKISNIARLCDIKSQNIYVALGGEKIGIRKSRLEAIIYLLGMHQDGTLRKVLHTWNISNQDQWESIYQCLQYDAKGLVIHAQPAYIESSENTDDDKKFIGFSITYEKSSYPRKILITDNTNQSDESEGIFKEKLESIAKKLECSIIFEKTTLAVPGSSAREVWRWNASQRAYANKIPIMLNCLGYNTSITSDLSNIDDPDILISALLSRFEAISKELNSYLGRKTPSADGRLANRAKEYLAKKSN